MKDNGIPLVGAVHDFTCPQTGRNYMFFPIKKLFLMETERLIIREMSQSDFGPLCRIL